MTHDCLIYIINVWSFSLEAKEKLDWEDAFILSSLWIVEGTID